MAAVEFQSTPPMRGATFGWDKIVKGFIISIHAPHAGSDIGFRSALPLCQISIHAPHAGSDFSVVKMTQEDRISIHAPHAGSDGRGSRGSGCQRDFNPRPPCGERLCPGLCIQRGMIFQSTPPMRGATRKLRYMVFPNLISIHAPHAGSDIRAQLQTITRF